MVSWNYRCAALDRSETAACHHDTSKRKGEQRDEIFKHSCGAIIPILPGLIEAGFDIINPVQINAKDMDSRRLKEEFGSQLTFWGGGVDTQKILPFGTPDEIRRHVMGQCEILGRDGGFVFNAVHNVQANVPVDNVVAMFDALKDIS